MGQKFLPGEFFSGKISEWLKSKILSFIWDTFFFDIACFAVAQEEWQGCRIEVIASPRKKSMNKGEQSSLLRSILMKYSIVMSILLITLIIAVSAEEALAGKGTVKDGVISLSLKVEDDVPYTSKFISLLKQRFIEASKYLYNATSKQNRLGVISIYIPDSWNEVSEAVTVAKVNTDIIDVLVPNSKVGSANSSTFGKIGGHINLGSENLSKSGCGKTIVHEMGHYCYGLGDEYCNMVYRRDLDPPGWYQVFGTEDDVWNKCTNLVTWEVTPLMRHMKTETYSYPESPSSPLSNHASIMWFQHLEPITEFCSPSNHNVRCENSQNKRNGYLSCWETMVNKKEFGLKLPSAVDIASISYADPTFVILRQSEAKRAEAPLSLILEGETDSDSYAYPKPVDIVACITRQGTPVRSATVRAVVKRPDGSTINVSLSDEGLQEDSFPLDGSYEGSFTEFNMDGLYEMTLIAENTGHTAVEGVAFPEMEPPEQGAIIVPQGAPIDADFTVQVELPPFNVAGYEGWDKLPPGKVTSLEGKVLSDLRVYLTWVASGDSDYDGKAQSYELRYSTMPIRDEEGWDSATPLDNLPAPQESGAWEEYTTPVMSPGIYYLALRVLDNEGNRSEISDNTLVQVSSTSGTAGGNFQAQTSSGSGGCFIATAAYGSPLHPHVAALRAFRDRYLLTSLPGRWCVSVYNECSPPLARWISGSYVLRIAARQVLAPVVMGVEKPGISAALFLMLALASFWVMRVIKGGMRRSEND